MLLVARLTLIMLVGLGGAAPASALIIGMNPDPLTTPDVVGTQARVDFLGATVGALPVGGTLLDGAIGAEDDVIELRFTNVGTSILNLVGISLSPLDGSSLTAVGLLPGGFTATVGEVSSPTFANVVVTAMPVGEFVDVFFALSGLQAGDQASLGVFGPFLFPEFVISLGEATLLVPEPSTLVLFALCACLARRGSQASGLIGTGR